MGYDIHIARRKHWSDDGEPVISREEWKTIIDGDPELECIDENDTAQMLDPTREAARFFCYSNGQIFVKKPNRAVLLKMLAVAEKLGARVIGDDEEVYSQAGLPDKPAQFKITDWW